MAGARKPSFCLSAIPHISPVRAAMGKLEQAARAGDETTLRRLLAELVPGYRAGGAEEPQDKVA